MADGFIRSDAPLGGGALGRFGFFPLRLVWMRKPSQKQWIARMHFTETGLKGAWLIETSPQVDSRGSFARTFCHREFSEHGLEVRFVQHSISHSVQRGTVRGMHFQQVPYGEVKLVSCIKGSILDVIVDMRQNSPTRLHWKAFELTADNGRELYIPKGFAHGFQTLEKDAIVQYRISEFYTPEAARGVRFDDPAMGIEWPLAPTVVSDKDRAWPLLHALV
jgi:dTDP-4-dehydrorhamnose 3,5-epimerase